MSNPNTFQVAGCRELTSSSDNDTNCAPAAGESAGTKDCAGCGHATSTRECCGESWCETCLKDHNVDEHKETEPEPERIRNGDGSATEALGDRRYGARR